MIDIPRKHKAELFAESESKFFLKESPIQVAFVKDKAEVTDMDVVADGQPYARRSLNRLPRW